jgi:hypothetical protein
MTHKKQGYRFENDWPLETLLILADKTKLWSDRPHGHESI